MSYLIHFNKNHDPKNGRFTFGDGDSDGIIDDHAHRRKNDMSKIASDIKDQVKKDSKEPTGNQNCQLCTWSAEAQFRGYSNSLPRPIYSPRDPALNIKGETIVKNPKKESFYSVSDINKKLDKINGDARFYVHVNWANSAGGHEFLIIKKGNNKYIMDPQIGHISQLTDKSEYFSNINYKNSYMARLDNKEFNTALFNQVNNRKNILEFNPKLDLPYMYKKGMISKEEYSKEMAKIKHSAIIDRGSYLIHFNPNHDPKTGRFTFSNENTVASRTRNYERVIKSLSDDEFRLFTYDGDDRNEDIKFMREYARWQPDHKDTRVFISKYGNVTLASLEKNGLGDEEWNIGWATDPKHRGTGITQINIKEAIAEIRKYSDLPISATIDQKNIPSQRTAEKAGFKDDGLTRMDDGSVHKRYIYK